MSCHVCGNSAIGLCRQCFKFYCQQHGNGYCSTCQQKGWSEEGITNINTSGWVGAFTSGRANVSHGFDRIEAGPEAAKETIGASAESEPEESQKKPESTESGIPDPAELEAMAAMARMQMVDQETLDRMTEPDKFVKLLPVFGSTSLNNVLMLIKGIELYQEAFYLDIIMRFGSDVDNGAIHRHMHPGDVILADNVGTEYHSQQRGGSGGSRDYSQNYIVTPALNPAAGQLTVRIEHLQVMEHTFHRPGSRSMPKKSFLNGPWTIVCNLSS